MSTTRGSDRNGKAVRYGLRASLLAIAGGVAVGWAISVAKERREASVEVRVVLDNRCTLIDDAFMVETRPSGQRAYFDKGIAKLTTRKQERVLLRASDRYPGFDFESASVRVAPTVVLVADCGDRERVDRTLDSMRDQFGGRAR